ncbi:MAG: hypothetical protein ABR535_00945 [Pyrinomonadaceae bacterium]
MASSLAYIGLGGFIAYIFVAVLFLRSGAPPGILVPITFFYFAALFGICFFILRQTNLLLGPKETPPRRVAEQAQPTYLQPANTAQLYEAREPGVGSVTEHTTKTLDEVPIRQK